LLGEEKKNNFSNLASLFRREKKAFSSRRREKEKDFVRSPPLSRVGKKKKKERGVHHSLGKTGRRAERKGGFERLLRSKGGRE